MWEAMNYLRTSVKEKYFRSTFWIILGLSLMQLNYLEAQTNQSNHIFFDGNGTVELFYMDDFDNITVVTLHNKSLGILQYFLKWEDVVPDDYTLKVFPLSSCGLKSVFLQHLNWTISEFYIPPTANYNFQIYKNCTYDIEIKANGHYLNVISYILDSMEIDINSTTRTKAKHIFLYTVYNKTIDRIQYVLKWKDGVPENGYEVKISSSSDDYCKKQMYSSSHVNESIAEIYIPSTSVSDFELYGNCSYDIEINSDERNLNIKNYIPGSVDIKHIILTTINNETINGIQYVMKWEDAAPEMYSVTVVMNSNSNSTYCNDKPYDSFDLNATVTELYIPPTDSYDFSLSGHCTYDIKVRTEETEKTIVNYIPVCVGNICNCKILSPQPRIPPSIEQIGTKLNISWFFHDSRENNITRIAIYLFEVTCDSSGNFTELKPNVLENNYALINIDEDMNGEHCITVSFTNTFNCSFSHADVKEVIYMRHEIKFWISWLIAIVSLLLLFTFVICYFHKFIGRQWRRLQSNQINRNVVSTAFGKKENINLLYIEKEILEGTKDKYEFPTGKIIIKDRIGKGAFGEVFLAQTTIRKETKYVAVKRLREKATHEEKEDFLDEINILKKIGCHPNIVTLVGCCTIREPYMMIMEYAPCGDLKKHLQDLRTKWYNKKLSIDSSVCSSRSSAYIIPDSADSPTTPKSKVSVSTQQINLSSADTPKSNVTEFNFEIEKVLDDQELQTFAVQIARGMEHLEKIPITHRDLAARNILINEHKVLKISDFGLSRNGPYINNKSKKLPLRWMAIESIEDHIYDNKSDVWSFGVVLWEIATLGAFPYEKVPDSMLLYYLQNGKRLTKPETCTDELYSLMLECWSRDKNSRPSFAEIVNLLDVKTRRVYVSFVQLNPLYVFPPTTCHNDWIPETVVNENTSKYLEFA